MDFGSRIRPRYDHPDPMSGGTRYRGFEYFLFIIFIFSMYLLIPFSNLSKCLLKLAFLSVDSLGMTGLYSRDYYGPDVSI